MGKIAKLLIGGELTEAADGRTFDSISPIDESVLGKAALAGASDVDAAVTAAESAWESWWALGVDQRTVHMKNLAAGIRARKEEIATLESRDTGSLYRAMLDDVVRAAARLEFYAGLGHAMTGSTYPATPSHVHFSEPQPYGAIARIVAFNHPFYFQTSRLGAPLIAGNAVIMKSPDQAPLSGGILAELCQEHLPPGVVNLLSGTGAVTGEALVRDPRVKRVGFIGSVATALHINRAAAEVSVKHVTHELGGKNMMVVMPDADPEQAAQLAVAGMNFEWQGQSCGSTSCLMVHDALYEPVLRLVKERIQRIKVGDPFDPASGMGALISRAHYDKVMAAIEQGQAQGAKLLWGGKRPDGELFKKGYWVEPTLFEADGAESAVTTTEIFGPVLTVIRWSDAAEILEKDRLSDLGLTASIVGKDVGAAMSFARKLRVGYVWINCVGPHFIGVPYGGFKNSGVGREEGLEEILSYTELKSVNVATSPLG